MSERIEHELNQLADSVVDVVRPFFGSQSDAWSGMIRLAGGDQYPLRFVFYHTDGSILFEAEDVVKVELRQNATDNKHSKAVIRLKGPQQYVGELAHA